jgi:hypothetical protein
MPTILLLPPSGEVHRDVLTLGEAVEHPFQATLKSGWWCPGCNASLIEFTNRMVAAGHARLDRVERDQ